MPDLNIGDTAPDFTLPITMSNSWKLSDHIGSKNIVILFFPLAFSPTCHEEMCSVGDTIKDFENLDAEVVAISVDSPFVLNKWKEELDLNFTLLSDFNKTASQSYGAFYYDLDGLNGVAKRSVFIVDKEGIIRYVWITDDAGELPNLEEVKEVLNKLP
jgi:peroxiredoxin